MQCSLRPGRNSGCLANDDGAPVSDTLAVGASGQVAADAAKTLARHLGQLQSALAATSNRNAPAEGEKSVAKLS